MNGAPPAKQTMTEADETKGGNEKERKLARSQEAGFDSQSKKGARADVKQDGAVKEEDVVFFNEQTKESARGKGAGVRDTAPGPKRGNRIGTSGVTLGRHGNRHAHIFSLDPFQQVQRKHLAIMLYAKEQAWLESEDRVPPVWEEQDEEEFRRRWTSRNIDRLNRVDHKSKEDRRQVKQELQLEYKDVDQVTKVLTTQQLIAQTRRHTFGPSEPKRERKTVGWMEPRVVESHDDASDGVKT
jgi:hypothetical protein